MVHSREAVDMILAAFKLNAACVELANYPEHGYTRVGIRVAPPTKISSVKRVLPDISLHLGLPNATMNVNEVCSLIELEFFNKRSKYVNYWDSSKQNNNYKIPLHLGVSNRGTTTTVDLSTCPHILIAGTTGSGKSTLLHDIMASLLSVNSNVHVIDTKQVELAPYKSLVKTVATSFDQAIKSVDYLNRLMNYRYHMMSKGEQSFIPEILIIDECADLFAQDLERKLYLSLLTLVQKCRAASIHVIMATQRPTASIIDGNIKGNFPVKIACRTVSKIDSRVILGQAGAETLLGKGDAIIDGASFQMHRFQAFFSDFTTNIINLG
jgi:S-DNA-T family DNA segregation ATPase FtsK/SpoIIIE